MAKMRITKQGEEVLKTVSEPVDYAELKPRLPKLLEDMWETMYAANGVGLAAPQVGLNIRLAVIDCRDEDGEPDRMVLINPEIVKKEGVQDDEEGCLSVPGLYAKVERAHTVTLRALDENGAEYERTASGLLARAFQHEVDHLDGKLFLDRLAFEKKVRALEIVKDLKKNWD